MSPNNHTEREKFEASIARAAEDQESAFQRAKKHWQTIELNDHRKREKLALMKTQRQNKMTVAELLDVHEETTKKCREVMRQKNSDYTGGSGVDDPFANFNMSSSFGIDPIVGILLRIGDKMRRIQSFANDGGLRVTGETVHDACEDIVNYAILIKGMCIERSREAASRVTYGDTVVVNPLSKPAKRAPSPTCCPGTACEGAIAEEDVSEWGNKKF
jgi:hypothetical protein